MGDILDLAALTSIVRHLAIEVHTFQDRNPSRFPVAASLKRLTCTGLGVDSNDTIVLFDNFVFIKLLFMMLILLATYSLLLSTRSKLKQHPPTATDDSDLAQRAQNHPGGLPASQFRRHLNIISGHRFQ